VAFEITSIHHVTATVADAQEDLDFYTGLLGLRLLKRTVNFDNPSVYHLYYGDERGSPSTIMTTFPYEGWGVPVGTKGAGQITAISFSAPSGSLDFWQDRLRPVEGTGARHATDFGEAALRISDPSGLRLELVERSDDTRVPWTPEGIREDEALRGIHHVTLTVRSVERSIDFLARLLGFQVRGEEGSRIRLGVGPGGPGTMIELERAGGAPSAVNGLGTVHHVAFAVATPEEQLEIRENLLSAGQMVTEVRDRQYFQSIYFREPGGVLLEVATAGPGFTVDEPVAELGEGLKLPPWEEDNRRSIEAHLPRLHIR
jgi:glyoxalase family protein